MINLILSILFLGCVVLIVKLWRENQALRFNQISNDNLLDDYQSRIKFWRTRCEEFNLDKAILHERNLRKRFETLYHTACDKIDKLEDKRKNNGTKHKQRTSKGNPIKNETHGQGKTNGSSRKNND